MLSTVWTWLYLSAKLVDDGTIRATSIKHPGVKTIITIDPENNKSETVVQTWAELGNPNCQGTAKYYKYVDKK